MNYWWSEMLAYFSEKFCEYIVFPKVFAKICLRQELIRKAAWTFFEVFFQKLTYFREIFAKTDILSIFAKVFATMKMFGRFLRKWNRHFHFRPSWYAVWRFVGIFTLFYDLLFYWFNGLVGYGSFFFFRGEGLVNPGVCWFTYLLIRLFLDKFFLSSSVLQCS